MSITAAGSAAARANLRTGGRERAAPTSGEVAREGRARHDELGEEEVHERHEDDWQGDAAGQRKAERWRAHHGERHPAKEHAAVADSARVGELGAAKARHEHVQAAEPAGRAREQQQAGRLEVPGAAERGLERAEAPEAVHVHEQVQRAQVAEGRGDDAVPLALGDDAPV
jgi:hypothetical protein